MLHVFSVDGVVFLFTSSDCFPSLVVPFDSRGLFFEMVEVELSTASFRDRVSLSELFFRVDDPIPFLDVAFGKSLVAFDSLLSADAIVVVVDDDNAGCVFITSIVEWRFFFLVTPTSIVRKTSITTSSLSPSSYTISYNPESSSYVVTLPSNHFAFDPAMKR